MGIAQDYNKINDRQTPVLKAINFLDGGETEDRGPRFSQRAVQQDDDRGKKSHHMDSSETETWKYQLFSACVP
jgi:hypothetical protein